MRFFRTSQKTGDGFYRSGNTLWLNVDNGIHPLSVFGHEWTHSLEESDKESHDALYAAVRAMMTPERALSFSKYYDQDNDYGWRNEKGGLKTDLDMDMLIHEVSADLGGNLAHDSTFYQEVFDEVARQHPHEKARTIIQKIATSLINAIDKLLASVGRNAYKQTFRTAEELGLTREELVAARDIIRSAAAKAVAKENMARAKGKPLFVGANREGESQVKENADSFTKPSAEGKEIFIRAPDGSIDFGEITVEQAKAMRRQAGKIRLQQGWHNDSTHEGSGFVHIERRHGEQIRNLGYSSIEDFIVDAVGQINEVWKPNATAQLVAVVNANKGRAIFIELQAARDEAGDFYTIRSAFPVSKGYAEPTARCPAARRTFGFPGKQGVC